MQMVLDKLSPLKTHVDPWEALPGDEHSEKKHLLRYYIEAMVPSISVATTASSFYTSLYIPMAFQSEGMLDAIMALSSAQLARRTSDNDRAQHLRDLSAKHQSKCHLFLRDRISPDGRPVKDPYQIIGITMLLVGLEALNGTKSTKWLSQIQCARRVLSTLYLEHNDTDSWEVDSLRRHVTYHDVMASLMIGVSKPEKHSAEIDFSTIYTPESSQTIDPLMGISYYLCSLICRIQYISTSTPAFPHLTQAAFDSLERDIQQWVYDSPLFYPGIDLPHALDLIALAESYRLAALIQLYRTSDAHKHLIASCASRAIQFISRIPPGSPAESSLLYPIFLAGAELISESEIANCFQRLKAIQERNRYENVASVREVLQEVWKPCLNGGEKRDWEDILREWNWSFTLG
jgi:hypothetical protein